MEDFSKILAETFEQCLATGMRLPFVICGVSPNGSVMALRMQGPGREPEWPNTQRMRDLDCL